MWRLACVILLIINRKTRTKPLCLWCLMTLLGIFSALLYLISYIHRCRIRLVNVKVLRHGNLIISIKCKLIGWYQRWGITSIDSILEQSVLGKLVIEINVWIISISGFLFMLHVLSSVLGVWKDNFKCLYTFEVTGDKGGSIQLVSIY